ncbi:MAG: TOBE domain-containing protein, partial [Bosea sp. (in: a-proteobacteria)]
SNLDAKLRVQMRIEIRKLHQRLGATSVFVTHDQVEAMSLADRLIVMNKGHVEQLGTPGRIYHQPASVFVAGFIGNPGMNLLPARVDADGLLCLDDGQRLAPPDRRHPDLVAGRRVTLGVRAQALRILAEAAGAHSLTAEVDFVEEMGSARHIHAVLAGQSVVAESEQPLGLAPRSRLVLGAEARDLHLFDAETGLRLAASGAGADASNAASASAMGETPIAAPA